MEGRAYGSRGIRTTITMGKHGSRKAWWWEQLRDHISNFKQQAESNLKMVQVFKLSKLVSMMRSF